MSQESSPYPVKQNGAHAVPARAGSSVPTRTKWVAALAVLILVIAVSLGIGLGVGLTRSSGSGSSSGYSSSTSTATATTSIPSSTATPTPTGSPNSTVNWQPNPGTTWQIVLQYALNDTSADVSVYDIDLFTNPSSTISALHALNRKVICYFSAGSYENFRPDSYLFKPSDYAKPLDGWPGEYWLDIKSPNVRNIMLARLDLAVNKSCDGVDPDNIDGYDNDTGLNETPSDAVDYITFLADAAHQRNLSIGLKNAGSIVNRTLQMMQWEVNEQCVRYRECDQFRPFIDAGKPVFHIEYPDSAPDVSTSDVKSICKDTEVSGFSTILKEMALNDWMEAC